MGKNYAQEHKILLQKANPEWNPLEGTVEIMKITDYRGQHRERSSSGYGSSKRESIVPVISRKIAMCLENYGEQENQCWNVWDRLSNSRKPWKNKDKRNGNNRIDQVTRQREKKVFLDECMVKQLQQEMERELFAEQRFWRLWAWGQWS